MNSFFERQFRLQENHTTVSTEVIAGLTTFATMGYVLAVVPHMMGEAGVPTGAMLTGMVLMIFVTSMAMGLYTNRPFALAPGMGSVAIFSITMVQLQNVPIGVASAIVFLSGLLFIVVTVLGIRKAIVMTIPRGIKISISAGVGIFLAVIGMRNAKLLAVNAKKVALSFGDLTQPVVLLAAITFIILLVLSARKVRSISRICRSSLHSSCRISSPASVRRSASGARQGSSIRTAICRGWTRSSTWIRSLRRSARSLRSLCSLPTSNPARGSRQADARD